jgi:hypothetical protein
MGAGFHSLVLIEEDRDMYLAIHLSLYVGAFVLFAWHLGTCLLVGKNHQAAPRPRDARRTFRRPSSRPSSSLSGLRVARPSREENGYRPVNRISRYYA